jgi:hypothetical protein
MSPQSRTLYGIIAILIGIIVIVSGLAASYYFQYNQAESQNKTYVSQLHKLNVKYVSKVTIDYGNGTVQWFNDTNVQPGWNLYTLTLLVTNGNVNATCCEFGSHFVQGIGGVQNTNTKDWFLWTFNSTALWQTAPVGPDEITVENNTVFAWTYCGFDSNYNPSCTPP